MIVTLSVPDELFQKYQEMFPKGVNKGMAEQLKRFSEFPPSERVVVLAPKARLALETLYTLPIEDSERFARWVKELATLHLDDAEVTLSPAQINFIQNGARFFQKQPGIFLAEKLRKGLQYALDGTV